MRDLWRLLTFMRPYWGWVVMGIMLSLVTVVANMALLALAGWFITAMALAGAAHTSMNYFTPAALIRAAALLRTVGRYAERLVTHEVTFRVLAALRVWFYERIEPLAPAGLERYHSGDVLSRIRADIDTLNNVYLRLMVPVIVAALVTLILVGVLVQYNGYLALIELGLLLLAGVGVPWWVSHQTGQWGAQSVLTRSQLRSQLVDDMQGMSELLVYGAMTQRFEQLKTTNQVLIEQQRLIGIWSSAAPAAVGFLAHLALGAVLWIVIPLVINKQLPPPELALLTLLALASFEGVQPLPLAAQTLGETLAAARRIFALADSESMIKEPSQPLLLVAPLTIELQNVSFTYPNAKTPALQNVSFTLNSGEKLALVGRSGVGKSSLLALLTRLRPVSSGLILINKQPIEAYHSTTVRQWMAVASQQAQLFNTTIRANLLLARPEASQQQLEMVCRVVLLDEFIHAQPQGYDTWVGETGVLLSGGQARRLSIARALLKPAALLLLDEPTEGLDADTAQQLMANVVAYIQQQGQSLIVVTHQPHGLAAMDKIVRLEHVQN